LRPRWERAKERIAARVPMPAELASAARGPGQFVERIVVKDGTRVTLIPCSKLDYAESQDDYVGLVSEGKKHLKQQTIASLERRWTGTFVRIHRSVHCEPGAPPPDSQSSAASDVFSLRSTSPT